MLIDAFPFRNELDVLEIRLHEMDPITDKFVILESRETFAGDEKRYYFQENERRFAAFRKKIVYVQLEKLAPPCTDRISGRLRERYQRNRMKAVIDALHPPHDAILSFGDCDEIPRAQTIAANLAVVREGIYRLKQKSYYYNVNTLMDYGHDWASRARVGPYRMVEEVGGMYEFRMAHKDSGDYALENGGWHFGYFGGLEEIQSKVATMAPFLQEYKMFGERQLLKDILDRKDLHHRRCEMPEQFELTKSDDPTLPAYFLANPEKFYHFTLEAFLGDVRETRCRD